MIGALARASSTGRAFQGKLSGAILLWRACQGELAGASSLGRFCRGELAGASSLPRRARRSELAGAAEREDGAGRQLAGASLPGQRRRMTGRGDNAVGSSAAATTRLPWPGAAAETTGAAAAAAAETEMALGLFSPRATRSKQGSADPRIEGPLPAPHRPCTPGRSPIEFGFDCFRLSVPGGRVVQAEWTAMVGGPFC